MSKVVKAARLLFSDPGVLLRKLENEFRAPSTVFTGVLRRVYCFIFPYQEITLQGNSDRFLLVYDTAASPVTFDFLHYLYYANWLRLQSGKTHLDIVVVVRPNLADSLVSGYRSAIGSDNITWRIFNLLVPLSRLFLATGRIYIVDQAQSFEIVKNYRNLHPVGYSYASPKGAGIRIDVPGVGFTPSIVISATAQEIVDAYFPIGDGRQLITVTLRTYDYIASRNSNIFAWVQFAVGLDASRYRVVFIPDASSNGIATIKLLKGVEIFDHACWNIELRAALYKRSNINMGVVCGPLTISAMMDTVKTIMIDRSLDYPADYRESIRSTGATLGEKPNFYSDSCHFFLGTDDVETIRLLFDAHAE